MPPNVFATTGTSVSVLFFDNSKEQKDVVLIDASQMGETYKDGTTQRTRLLPNEIDKIVNTFLNKEEEDKFSAIVTHDKIKEKGYSLSAGSYFDIVIKHNDITNDEFKTRVNGIKGKLKEMFAASKTCEEKILSQLDKMSIK